MIALLQRKPFIPLAVLLLANLLLLSVQVRNAEGRLLLRSGSLLLFTPIASTVHFMVDGVTGAVKQYALLYSAPEGKSSASGRERPPGGRVGPAAGDQVSGFTPRRGSHAGRAVPV